MKLQRISDAPSGATRIEFLIGVEETELLLGCVLTCGKHIPMTPQNSQQRMRLRQMKNELIKGMKLWKPTWNAPK